MWAARHGSPSGFVFLLMFSSRRSIACGKFSVYHDLNPLTFLPHKTALQVHYTLTYGYIRCYLFSTLSNIILKILDTK